MMSPGGAPSARGFVKNDSEHTPIAYSKRVYAANFILAYMAGVAPWAALAGDPEETSEQAHLKRWAKENSPEYRQFLEDTSNDTEYAAYQEHEHTPSPIDY